MQPSIWIVWVVGAWTCIEGKSRKASGNIKGIFISSSFGGESCNILAVFLIGFSKKQGAVFKYNKEFDNKDSWEDDESGLKSARKLYKLLYKYIETEPEETLQERKKIKEH